MVRTRGAHRYMPKAQFSTPERDGAGTSKAAAAHSPDQVTETPPALAPTTAMIQGPAPTSISKEAPASKPPSGDTRLGWDLGPLPLCIRDHAGGPRLPSGQGHLARVSLRDLGSSRRLLQLIRVHRPSYPRLRGSGALCLAAIRFQGTSIFVSGTSMKSHTTTYRR